MSTATITRKNSVVYYLGPKGSFSHEAALNLSGEHREANTITDVFKAVLTQSNAFGVVPVENSLEGPVNETLDNLYFEDEIFVGIEIQKKIDLVLATKDAAGEIKRIYSHPYALREAQHSLSRISAQLVPVESTSKAATLALQNSESAALCSRFAAKLYDLKVVHENLQDGVNITRFVAISREISKTGEKTMLLTTVPHRPGGLYRLLERFYHANINLTMIYSRPIRNTPWHYYFYIEFDGEIDDRNVSSCLSSLSEVANVLKIKGSYHTKKA
jgi:prephenate dehydratase